MRKWKSLLKADYIQTGYRYVGRSVRTVCLLCVYSLHNTFNITQDIQQLKPVLADPLHACSPLVNAVRGSLVMAIRGECPLLRNWHAENAGASVVMIFNTEPDYRSFRFQKRSVTSMVVTERTRREMRRLGVTQDASAMPRSVRIDHTWCALERFEQVPGRKEVPSESSEQKRTYHKLWASSDKPGGSDERFEFLLRQKARPLWSLLQACVFLSYVRGH